MNKYKNVSFTFYKEKKLLLPSEMPSCLESDIFPILLDSVWSITISQYLKILLSIPILQIWIFTCVYSIAICPWALCPVQCLQQANTSIFITTWHLELVSFVHWRRYWQLLYRGTVTVLYSKGNVHRRSALDCRSTNKVNDLAIGSWLMPKLI